MYVSNIMFSWGTPQGARDKGRGILKLTQEAAGYTGGDVHFLKSEAELQLNKSLFWDWVCFQYYVFMGGHHRGQGKRAFTRSKIVFVTPLKRIKQKQKHNSTCCETTHVLRYLVSRKAIMCIIASIT